MSPARVITAVTAALLAVVAAATPAVASTAPDSASWPVDENALSTIEWIGLFIGGTALVYVVIWVLAAAVNAKSTHFVPEIPPATPKADHDIEATQRMPLPAAEGAPKH
ncbi:hypothetical protein [Aeromicrobium choanae]|uniref:Secreted protein n=1 Tax=Aeromicrobium choanae TaxID=1736691 RepID=A0A1T4Z4K2_9ACTN|nr:hypothetical protein [Aeromicrobium choanae]SKB08501.1 hypothetical protein SAMN06295964_2184 [Aeromicrobium choanae]